MSVNTSVMHYGCCAPNYYLHITFRRIKVRRIRGAEFLMDFVVQTQLMNLSMQKLLCIIGEDGFRNTVSRHAFLQHTLRSLLGLSRITGENDSAIIEEHKGCGISVSAW